MLPPVASVNDVEFGIPYPGPGGFGSCTLHRAGERIVEDAEKYLAFWAVARPAVEHVQVVKASELRGRI